MKKRKFFFITSAVFMIFLGILVIRLVVRWEDSYEEKTVLGQEEEVTLKWYINYSWFGTEWGRNLVSQKITEETGVNIEFIVPKGNETEKLDSMLASGTLPDLVTLGWYEKENQRMISGDQVYALNELADKYDKSFYQAADEEVIKWFTQSDGNIYGYPNHSYTYHDFLENADMSSHQNFLVRKDIYEAIGSPDMTTPEGFSDAVKEAARMFPQVDGKPLIPIGGAEFTNTGNNSFDVYLQNFLAIPREKNGEFYDRNTDEEYISWLKVLRQLGEEGYLSDEIFIDKRYQLEEKIREGRYFCLFYQNIDMEDQIKAIYSENPEQIYMAVEGPRNSKGEDPQLPVPGVNGWTVTYISKNCTVPDRAIRFISYMLSEEGQKLICYGVEGEMYQMDGDTLVRNPEIVELVNTDRSKYNELYGADSTYWMFETGISVMNMQKETPDYIREMNEWAVPYTVYSGQYELNFGEDAEMTNIYDNLSALWGDTLPRLLLADTEKEFDEILEEYICEREENNYREFCEAVTKLYKANKEKLGIEE